MLENCNNSKHPSIETQHLPRNVLQHFRAQHYLEYDNEWQQGPEISHLIIRVGEY